MINRLYVPLDLKRDVITRRNYFRRAMVGNNPEAMRFSEGIVHFAGREVLFALEVPYTNTVDSLIGVTIEQTSRGFQREWIQAKEAVLKKEKVLANEKYDLSLAQRLREACEREFSGDATIVVPGYRVFVSYKPGRPYAITSVREKTEREGIRTLFHKKGFKRDIQFWDE